jgi:hypothetical protein
MHLANPIFKTFLARRRRMWVRDRASAAACREMMMGQIVSLHRTEPAMLDYAVLHRLEESLGRERSREVLSDACCVIIEKLTRFEIAEDADESHRLARNIAALGDEVGLSELGRAARAASDCALRPDIAASSATAGRMLRLAEASLDMLLSHQATG